MSLTGHLKNKDSPIRQFLRTRFPNTRSFLADDRKRIREADTIRPREAVPWFTIGTALDYRIRYYFGLTPSDQLNAYRGARTLSVIHHAREGDLENVGYDALRADFDAFFGSLEELTKRNQTVGKKLTESDEDRLNRHCVVIDIKTTVEQRIRSEWIWQSLGYALLDYSDRYRIDAIGLYVARQGIFFKWDLRDAIRCLYAGEPPSIEELRSQFKELARSSRQERARMRRMR